MFLGNNRQLDLAFYLFSQSASLYWRDETFYTEVIIGGPLLIPVIFVCYFLLLLTFSPPLIDMWSLLVCQLEVMDSLLVFVYLLPSRNLFFSMLLVIDTVFFLFCESGPLGI